MKYETYYKREINKLLKQGETYKQTESLLTTMSILKSMNNVVPKLSQTQHGRSTLNKSLKMLSSSVRSSWKVK